MRRRITVWTVAQDDIRYMARIANMTAYIHAGTGKYSGSIILDVEHDGKGRTWMFDSEEPTLEEIQDKFAEFYDKLMEVSVDG